jgi:hypothetical protein
MGTVPETARLESVWSVSSDFLRYVQRSAEQTAFVYRVATVAEIPPIQPGSTIEVSIRFADRGTEFNVHAHVLERLESGSPLGLRLAFLPEEKARQELVLLSAEGESVPYLRRRAPRLACRLPTTVEIDRATSFETLIVNISDRGAYLLLERAPPDATLTLDIAFPGAKKPTRLRGRVTAQVAGPKRGIGIEFLFESTKQRDALVAEVTRLREALAP